jgi:hypothetical protein
LALLHGRDIHPPDTVGGTALRHDARAVLRRIVCLRVCDVPVMALSARMFVFLAWMDESLMAYEQVASGESLATEVTDERLLFCVCTNMALEVLLRQC